MIWIVSLQRLAVGLFSALLLAGCVSDAGAPKPPALWTHLQGEGSPAVVFISGNGADSTVWAALEPEIRKQGVRTVVYDRAGLGQSPLAPGAYSIDDEADALRAALQANGVDENVILAAHSYGGLIAALVAEDNPAVDGLILIDALLPGDLSDEVVANVLAEYTPQFAALEAAAPDLAKAIIPIVKAYPATAERMKTVAVSPELPVIDILAETTWVSAPEDVAHIRSTHAAFAAASPARKTVYAEASSHNVMKDRPDIVLDAAAEMIGVVRAAGGGD